MNLLGELRKGMLAFKDEVIRVIRQINARNCVQNCAAKTRRIRFEKERLENEEGLNVADARSWNGNDPQLGVSTVHFAAAF